MTKAYGNPQDIAEHKILLIEHEHLSKKHAELQAQVDKMQDMSKQVGAMEQQHVAKSVELSNLQDSINTAKYEKKALEAAILTLQTQSLDATNAHDVKVAEFAADILDLQKQQAEADQALKVVISQISAKNKEYDTIINLINELDDQKVKLSSDIEVLTTELKSLVERGASKTQEVEDLKASVIVETVNLDAARKQLAEVQPKLDALNAQLVDLEAKLASKQAELDIIGSSKKAEWDKRDAELSVLASSLDVKAKNQAEIKKALENAHGKPINSI